ncbi:MAG: large conductance mechanosensitive channel protein MscL [Actinomycetota bacterium]|nr:large conductance mechanosensitive channel protein MscL [Actinomycetota bacterium]
MKAWLEDFKRFLIQGNLVTLAVAFVIGAAFAAVVKALVADIITPIIALIFGQPDFENLSFTINSSRFLYGDFLNVLFAFAATAAAVYFFVVRPYDTLQARRSRGADPDVKACPECTTDIPFRARRCPACTAQLAPTP